MKEILGSALAKFNISLVLLVAYAVKMILLSPNYADAMVLAVLAACYCFTRHIRIKEPMKASDRSKEEVAKLVNEVNEIKGALTKVNVGKLGDVKRYF